MEKGRGKKMKYTVCKNCGAILAWVVTAGHGGAEQGMAGHGEAIVLKTKG